VKVAKILFPKQLITLEYISGILQNSTKNSYTRARNFTLSEVVPNDTQHRMSNIPITKVFSKNIHIC